MGMKEVPKHWVISCDGCANEAKPQTGTHRPSGWGKLEFEQGAIDGGGSEVADGSIRGLFCPICRGRIEAAILGAYKAPVITAE